MMKSYLSDSVKAMLGGSSSHSVKGSAQTSRRALHRVPITLPSGRYPASVDRSSTGPMKVLSEREFPLF